MLALNLDSKISRPSASNSTIVKAAFKRNIQHRPVQWGAPISYLYDLEPSHFYRGAVLLINNCELFFLVGKKSVYHFSIHLCSDSFLPFGQQYPPARSLHKPHKQEVPSSHHLPQHKFPPVVQETVLSYSCYVLLQPKES